MSDHSTISIQLQPVSTEQSDILISELSDIGYYAFEEEEGALIAYIAGKDFEYDQLKNILPGNVFFEKKVIEEQNWNSQWESDFQPVIVNDFAAVRAEFHEPIKGVKHDLLITPKMSFGTGHHATTFMMIELMEKIGFENKKVLDFGTGTGVLAILAEKLGASEIIAIDMDEWSINNTIENIAANGCNRIHVEQKDDLSGIEKVDVILANINLNVITDSCEKMVKIINHDGLILTSGFLQSDQNKMLQIFSDRGFDPVKTISKDIWSSILFKRKVN